MKRFLHAQVGDKVYCRVNGYGEIVEVYYYRTYPILVQFESGKLYYTFEGKFLLPSVEPILFYVDGDNNYSETRPVQTIHAKLVPMDTKVYCCSDGDVFNRYFSHYDQQLVYAFMDGCDSFTINTHHNNSVFCRWLKMTLAEELIIDGVTYPIGTEIKC